MLKILFFRTVNFLNSNYYSVYFGLTNEKLISNNAQKFIACKQSNKKTHTAFVAIKYIHATSNVFVTNNFIFNIKFHYLFFLFRFQFMNKKCP